MPRVVLLLLSAADETAFTPVGSSWTKNQQMSVLQSTRGAGGEGWTWDWCLAHGLRLSLARAPRCTTSGTPLPVNGAALVDDAGPNLERAVTPSTDCVEQADRDPLRTSRSPRRHPRVPASSAMW